MKTIQVNQMCSPRTGNPVANQFKIYTPEGKYFQSYRSVIAFVDKFGQIMLDEYYHNYSRTTSKYLTQFLDMNTKERTKAIKNKEIILTNLN